ncbi:MAG: hypothetical protein ACXWKP_20825 [Bradyrhizobium sp.]
MPRRKKPEHELNAFEQYAADLSRPSYNRDAGRILYGEHDVQVSVVVAGVDADGDLVAEGYELDIAADPRLVRWIDSLIAFNDLEHPDKAPLVQNLLDSNVELLPIVSYWLADLFRRYSLKKKRGVSPSNGYERKVLALVKVLDDLPDAWDRLLDLTSQRIQLAAMIERFDFINPSHRPRLPAYDLSDPEAQLHLASAMVRHLRSTNATAPKPRLDDAISTAATKYDIDPERLRTHYNGRRGATRRIKTRITRP